MKTNNLIVFAAATLLTACGQNDTEYDATGTFETTEITVSAEQNGRLLALDITEGTKIKKDSRVGLIDTVQLHLKAMALGATKDIYAYQRPDISKQIAATRSQLAKAERERARFEALVSKGAANSKALDDAMSTERELRDRLQAQISSLDNNTRSLNSQMSAADIQRLEVLDMLNKCHIKAPIDGTVLEKYAEAGEYAVTGKPLFKIADMENMFIRAYVTTAQLEKIKLGQRVKVMSDYGNGNRKTYEGIVAWISESAEFTPKTILTDDERADIVYAVKVAVKSDGMLKIGMYGEVKF
ncbi:MAG: efflux RND transporter periplasmic adaptor subunit [Prevotella sp.]|nr:efflux RND transporter periplasmic adaptor subunit [Prevotella sp.]